MGFVELFDIQEKILKTVMNIRKASTATFRIEKISRKDKDNKISGIGNKSPYRIMTKINLLPTLAFFTNPFPKNIPDILPNPLVQVLQ